ncbi:acyltransferase domain-containing protein [Streptomyces sp. NBS 14/10]|uniref:acyltransferase domain-containing protein n=1 Tax=Streptomyces sp. NBS 14/10 TaxID=1945643 RepID=UPI000B7E3C4B|nr:acyltransferase domain-containing protein [Streptomyces sp. NBS 14/10]KAK1185851.1 acyltransferase domain-containing protein [Streptomyces sp. NBS 14/10]
MVKVDYPSHGPLMREPAQRLTEALGSVESAPGTVPFYSTVHGGPYRGALDTAYWQANLTSPVLARGAVHAMADAGITHLLEISPHPVLLVALRECLQDRDEPAAALATVHRDRPARHGLYEVAAELYEHGWCPTGDADVATRRHATLLPRHPFRRDRVHRPGPAGAPAGAGTVPGAAPGTLVELAFQPDTFVADLRLTGHHRDHVVAGRPVLSATGLAALASWAAAEAGAG